MSTEISVNARAFYAHKHAYRNRGPTGSFTWAVGAYRVLGELDQIQEDLFCILLPKWILRHFAQLNLGDY